MNKINGLVLSALTAAFLVGCGGGSSSSDSSTASSNSSSTSSRNNYSTVTTTDVTVERGTLLGCNCKGCKWTSSNSF